MGDRGTTIRTRRPRLDVLHTPHRMQDGEAHGAEETHHDEAARGLYGVGQSMTIAGIVPGRQPRVARRVVADPAMVASRLHHGAAACGEKAGDANNR